MLQKEESGRWEGSQCTAAWKPKEQKVPRRKSLSALLNAAERVRIRKAEKCPFSLMMRMSVVIFERGKNQWFQGKQITCIPFGLMCNIQFMTTPPFFKKPISFCWTFEFSLSQCYNKPCVFSCWHVVLQRRNCLVKGHAHLFIFLEVISLSLFVQSSIVTGEKAESMGIGVGI